MMNIKQSHAHEERGRSRGLAFEENLFDAEVQDTYTEDEEGSSPSPPPDISQRKRLEKPLWMA